MAISKNEESDDADAEDKVALSKFSEYEQARILKMRRNHERLSSLGLITMQQEEDWNLELLGMQVPARFPKAAVPTEDSNDSKPGKRRKSVKAAAVGGDAKTISGRKSLRLRGLTPSGSKIDECENQDAAISAPKKKRKRPLPDPNTKSKNPTATYEHCRMRIHSMSHQGLKRRMSVIEKSAGRDCILKMTIFHHCLRDEGMPELADQAKEALDRLFIIGVN